MRRFAPGSREAWGFVLVSLVALISLASFSTTGPETPEERIQELADQYACPQCQGQSVAESNAAVARNIVEFISDEVYAGSTDTQIRDDLVRGYGTEVLLNPPSSGWNSLIWILPVLVLVGGTAIVASSIASARSRSGSLDPTAAEEALVQQLRLGGRDRGADGE